MLLPLREIYGLTAFHVSNTIGLGPVFSPVTLCPCDPNDEQINQSRTVLVQACQHIWLVTINDVYRQFTCVTHTDLPSDRTPVVLGVLGFPRGDT